MTISLSVKYIKAFISKNSQSALDVLKKDLDLRFIPAIERRRLSDASKIAFSLLGDSPIKIPIIFSSQKGEINRCFAMLNDLAAHNITSPTAFSLSVLNSTPALLAIAQKNHSEILAISAKDCLEYGLVNAYVLLYESSNDCKANLKDCLLISYEETLHSKDISVVIACVSLDSALPQIIVKKCNQSNATHINAGSNLSFLGAFAKNIECYKNSNFALNISDLLENFNLADF